jgi:transcriptional regulator with XRE-family HTH domain
MTTAKKYAPARRLVMLTPGEMLKTIRELQGFTQSELSRRSGIAQPSISAFEKGRLEMGLKTVRILADALSVHPAVIAFPDWDGPTQAPAKVSALHPMGARPAKRRAKVA